MDKSHEDLWRAVVLQVQADIATAPLDSLVFAGAKAWCCNAGTWSDSRRNIAEMLSLHEDDLSRAGRAWIAARRLNEGLPAEKSTQTGPQFPALVLRTAKPDKKIGVRPHFIPVMLKPKDVEPALAERHASPAKYLRDYHKVTVLEPQALRMPMTGTGRRKTEKHELKRWNWRADPTKVNPFAPKSFK